MKSKIVRSNCSSFLSILFILFIPVNFFPQDFKAVYDGVEYAEVTRKIGDDAVKINLLRLDLTKVRLDVHHAMDAAIGTEKTSSIATRHGAIAAINAGFFRLDKSVFAGDASGVLVIDGKILSESVEPRIAMLIFNTLYECTHCKPIHNTSVTFENLKVMSKVFIGKDKLEVQVSGFNRQRKTTEAVIYTKEFGMRTPLFESNAVEIIFDGKKITEVAITGGGTVIPKKGFVLVLDPSEEKKVSRAIARGRRSYSVLVPFVDRMPTSENQFSILYRLPDHAVGGVPQLIKNGKIDITWEQEKSSKAFVETRHPRTAVAKMKDGKFLMVTVDGRQPGVSVGMNLNELAAYLLELGAVDAMNLDGGGSTTMFLDGKVVNKPSDKEGERKVSDAILVTLRKKSASKK